MVWPVRHGILANQDAGPIIGQANTLGLNGTTQYLDCGNGLSLQLTTQISIFGWVRLASKGSNRVIAGKFNTTGNQRGYMLYYENTTDTFSLTISSDGNFGATQSAVRTTSPISLNTWYFVCATYDGTTMRMYLNGVEEASTPHAGGIHNSTANFYIGARGGPAEYLNGSLSQIGTVNRALVSNEVTSLNNLGKSFQPQNAPSSVKKDLVLWIPLNSEIASGREFDDFSGFENNASPQGGAAIDGDLINIDPGLVYNSAKFERSNSDNINAGNDVSLQPLNGLTLATWFNTADMVTGPGKYNPLIARRTGGTLDWQITHILATDDTGGADVYKIRFDQNGYQDECTFLLNDANRWYHIAVTYDESNVRFYIDGDLKNTFANSNALTANASQVVLGHDGDVSYIEGNLAFPYIGNKALTANEIKSLSNMNSVKDFVKLPQSVIDACVLAYNLNSNDGTFTDLSGNGNDGTNNGVTFDGPEIDWDDTNSFIDAATLLFNGSTQYLTIPDSNDFNLGTAFTYTCWIRLNAIGSSNYIYAQLEDSDEFIIFEVLASGKLHLQCYNVSELFDFQSTATLVANTWYQVGFQIDGTTAKIIIDGAFDPTTDTIASTPPNYAANIQLGRWPSDGNYFNGAYSLPYAKQAVLALSDLETLYAERIPKQPWLLPTSVKDNAVLLLALNEQTDGNEYNDYSGNGNNATPVNAPTLTGADLTIETSQDPGP